MTTQLRTTIPREPHRERDRSAAPEVDVLALVAHELKQPLAAIEVAVPIMAEAPEDASRARARRVIERQLIYMRRLVDDLLDAERARRGDLHLEVECLDLRSLVDEAARTFQVRARQHGVTLTSATPSVPVMVDGDRVRLQQVLSNLLENALKHTNAGGTIDVRLHCSGPQAFISVKDTGDGIPIEVLPHVFEPYRHFGNGGGLGIGLNLARRLLERHGGQITAHSAGPGAGAEFVLMLPISSHALRQGA